MPIHLLKSGSQRLSHKEAKPKGKSTEKDKPTRAKHIFSLIAKDWLSLYKAKPLEAYDNYNEYARDKRREKLSKIKKLILLFSVVYGLSYGISTYSAARKREQRRAYIEAVLNSYHISHFNTSGDKIVMPIYNAEQESIIHLEPIDPRVKAWVERFNGLKTLDDIRTMSKTFYRSFKDIAFDVAFDQKGYSPSLDNLFKTREIYCYPSTMFFAQALHYAGYKVITAITASIPKDNEGLDFYHIDPLFEYNGKWYVVSMSKADYPIETWREHLPKVLSSPANYYNYIAFSDTSQAFKPDSFGREDIRWQAVPAPIEALAHLPFKPGIFYRVDLGE